MKKVATSEITEYIKIFYNRMRKLAHHGLRSLSNDVHDASTLNQLDLTILDQCQQRRCY